MSDSNDNLSMKPGRVSWNELVTQDTKAATNFYGRLKFSRSAFP